MTYMGPGRHRVFDVVVIGGGPAGVTAALRATELGASVCLVERSRIGGVCVNDGCVPTRVLAKTARLMRDAEQFQQYGLLGPRPTLDFAQLMARTRQVVDVIHQKKELVGQLERSGATVFTHAGDTRFEDEHTVATADGHSLQGEKFIIATGGRARRVSLPGARWALTHRDLWSLEKLPRSVVVVGGAATGSQLTSILAGLGSQVWLLDTSPRILASEDIVVSDALRRAFEQRGVTVVTRIHKQWRIEPDTDGLVFHYRTNGTRRRIKAEAVVLAVGWLGNGERLNLTAANVKTEGGFIPVDGHLRTSAHHIFAAGDITGRMLLVQSAVQEARLAAENAVMGIEEPYEHRVVPHGGFTDPEYASVGLTQNEADPEENYAFSVVPYGDLDRAVIDDRPYGFFKLIASRESHRVLGAHVVGEQAVEVAQIVAAGMAVGMRVHQLAELELAYPTFTAIAALAARKLCEELGCRRHAPQRQAYPGRHPAEWERATAIKPGYL